MIAELENTLITVQLIQVSNQGPALRHFSMIKQKLTNMLKSETEVHC